MCRFARWNDPDYCCGKAIDNRAACAVLTVLMERLADGEFPGHLLGGGHRPGGAGSRGRRARRPGSPGPTGSWPWMSPSPATRRKARRAAGRWAWAQARSSTSGDFLESPKKGYFIHPGLKAAALEVSRQGIIPVQLQAIYGNSYTDARRWPRKSAGIPCISLGIPIRYSHAPSSVCHLADMESCLELAEALIRRGVEKKEFNFLR